MGIVEYVKNGLSGHKAAQTGGDDIRTQIKEEARNVLALYASEGELKSLTPERFIGEVLLNPTKDIWKFSINKASECKYIIDETLENVMNGIDDLTKLNPNYRHSRDSLEKLVKKSNSGKKY